MKKNVIKSTLAVAILTVAGFSATNMYENYEVKKSELLKLNIEALTENENGGTPVANCYTNATDFSSETSFEHLYVCDSKTTDNEIFPCPAEKNYIIRGIGSKCTK